MKLSRSAIGILGVFLAMLSAWQIREAGRGLQEINIHSGTLPITFIGPAGEMDGSRPLVLIGHGFAGSRTVMRGFALNFAHAGYVVALWDFEGHGSNPNPLRLEAQSTDLVEDAETALAEARSRGLADTSRVAILGHSMGSGVALIFGQKHPETAATIAISPVSTQVTPELPHNLLLLAGALEPSFASSAQQRLTEAGGAGGDPAQGTGRKLVIVPGVEHITILFSSLARTVTRDWLDATFGPQPGAQPYQDVRVIWFGLGVLGTLLAAAMLVPWAKEIPLPNEVYRSLGWRVLSLTAGTLGSTLLLWAASRAGLQLGTFLGLRVGGYVLGWFGLAGLIALLFLRTRLPFPTLGSVLAGLLIFAALWTGVGLLGEMVWLPWLLIPRRLVLWPLASLFMFLWFLAAGETDRKSSLLGRLGWWLLHSILIYASLTLAMRLSPELGFLILILPITPILLLLHAIPTLSQPARWVIALSGSLFVSWMLLAVFPLA